MDHETADQKCARCGRPLPEDARFCPSCGKALEPPIGEKTQTGKPRGSGRKTSWIPVLIISLLGVICLLSILLGAWEGAPDYLASKLETVVSGFGPTKTSTPTPTPTATATATMTRTCTATPTATPPPMPPADAVPGDRWTSPVDGMVLVFIRHDRFMMGSPDSDLDALISEKPIHNVDLDSYWVDLTEVTNSMYAGCVKAGACKTPKLTMSITRDSYFGNPEFDNHPVIWVSWQDASTYCAWAGRRLPTEAEWEMAARGAKSTLKYPWGNNAPTCALANFGGYLQSQGCVGDTTPVGKYLKTKSPYGILDLAGNVWEWVRDWKGPNYIVQPTKNPTGFENGEYKVIRGGSWATSPATLRTASRAGWLPEDSDNNIGFRCALSIP